MTTQKPFFQRLVDEEIKCEICGSGIMAIYGCWWDNDRILCLDNDCGAEYVFPTSTLLDADQTNRQ